MAKLSNYIDEKKIICVRPENIKSITEDIVEVTLDDRKDIVEKAKEFLRRKEVIITLDLGNGFAITHGRIEGLEEINIGIALLKEPVSFENVKDVKVIFCILVPPKKHRVYLSLLAYISRMFSHEEAKDIFNCEDGSKIVDFINKIEAED